MSTLVREQESRLLESEEELYSYFQQFAKPDSERQVGIECEFFGIYRETGQALPYLGPTGIEAILSRLSAAFHYEPVLEDGHVIALKRGNTMVTLEPGGQVELSAPPVANIFEVESVLQSFTRELHEIKKYFPKITWLSVGIHPFSPLDEISWVPKKRYSLMADYLKSHGTLSHEMMKLTATDQVSLDFSDEQTAFEQFRVIFAISPIASAIFANSCFSSGKPNGFLTRRVHIWQHMDPDRSGLLLQFIEEGKNFRDYVNYLLDMPMMFILRQEKWIPMNGVSFRKFLREGKDGEHATWGDFELHLSTAFPEARFKQYLEIRGIDAQKPALIPAVAAFWKGILYDETIRRKTWDLVRNFKPEERMNLYQEVPRLGLRARLGKTCVMELAEVLYRLSCEGLGRQEAGEHPSECVYLDRMNEEILKPRRTPAEKLLEEFHWGRVRDREDLIRYFEI